MNEELFKLLLRMFSFDFLVLFERPNRPVALRLRDLLKTHGYSSKLVRITREISPASVPVLNKAKTLLVLISGPLSQVTRVFIRTWLKYRQEQTVYAVILRSPPSALPMIFRRPAQALVWIGEGQDRTSNEMVLRWLRVVKHQDTERLYKWSRGRELAVLSQSLRRSYDFDSYKFATSMEAFTRLPRKLTLDRISFSVWSMATVRPGEVITLDVFLHKPEQTPSLLGLIDRIQRLAGRSEPSSLRTEGPVQFRRGTTLTVKVSIEGCSVSPPIKMITWTGEIGSATFVLRVPLICPRGQKVGRVSIKATGLEIATIQFVVDVSKASDRKGAILESKKTYHRTAFASYATADRDAVLARVQGIQKIQPTLNVFLDVMKLRSGDDWKRRLEEEIVKAGVFYLFWCRHARRSEWVGREWRYALRAKGLDFIDPVPFEPPDKAPPPWRLSGKKHFNDPILAFMTTSGHD
jgi:TIR domain